jgi:hypothetical protein
MNENNNKRIFDKSLYSHKIISDVLIVYLKTKKANGKNYFYICDKDFGLQESGDDYVVQLATKGKCD